MRRLIWLVVGCLIPILGVAEESGLRRWAILSDSALRESGVSDRLLVALSREGIELVEREQLDVVSREWSLARLASSQGGAERVKLGRMLKADALLLLSAAASRDRSRWQVVVCDGRAGARLRLAQLPAPSDDLTATVAALRKLIADVQRQYPRGVEQVFAVLPFINRSLTREHDRYRHGWAGLLGETLAAAPGAATLELEEAHALGTETGLHGGPSRVVPVIVTADYRVMVADGTNAPRVRFEVRWQRGATAAAQTNDHELALVAATAWVAGPLARLLLGEAETPARVGLTADEQFAALVRQADVLARAGEQDQAVGLREAALLLRPDDVRQRQIVMEVIHGWLQGDPPAPPLSAAAKAAAEKAAAQRAAEPPVKRFDRRGPDAFLRWWQHYEQLALVTRSTQSRWETGSWLGLGYMLIQNHRGSWFMAELRTEKRRIARSLWEFFAALPDTAANQRRYEQACDQIGVWMTGTGDWPTLLAELLVEVAPAPRRLPSRLSQIFLRTMKSPDDEPNTRANTPPISDADFVALLERLERSTAPVAQACAKVGRAAVLMTVPPARLDTNAALAAVTAAQQAWQTAFEKGDDVTRQLATWRALLSGEPLPVAAKPTPKSQPAASTPNPVPSAPPPEVGGLRFSEPLALSVRKLDGQVVPLREGFLPIVTPQERQVRWMRQRKMPVRWVNCGDGAGLFWHTSQMLLAEDDRTLRELVADESAPLRDVVWDGRHIWVARRDNTIWLLNRLGERQQTVNQTHNLPPSEKGLLLHPIEASRVLAVGSTEAGRAWIATITATNAVPVVHVFHEAKHEAYAGQTPDQLRGDIRLTFVPQWVLEDCGSPEADHRTLLIGRSAGHRYLGCEFVTEYPLAVNLQTLAVSVFTAYFKQRPQLCWQGEFVCAGRLHLGLVQPLRAPSQDATSLRPGFDSAQRKSIGSPMAGEIDDLLRVDDMLYVAGPTWWRVNLRTRVLERLVSNTQPLPHADDGIGISQNTRWGLIGWDPYQFEAIYHVTLPPSTKDSPATVVP